MSRLPEGVAAYPRWDGPLATGSRFGLVMAEEIRRSFNNFWSRLALMFIAAYSVVYIADLANESDSLHTKATYLDFIENLRWGGLALAAVMGGTGLLEDARRGALDLYLSRSITPGEYLAGKILGVFLLSTLAIFLPGLLYFGASFFLFDTQPEGWNTILFGTFLHAVFWGLLVSGLALGLSCVSRSSRGATLLLFGGFAVLEIVLSKLLEAITQDTNFRVLSPFAALKQQNEWMFDIPAPYDFPTWWGLAIWAILVILGWLLVAWKHPRARGVERV